MGTITNPPRNRSSDRLLKLLAAILTFQQTTIEAQDTTPAPWTNQTVQIDGISFSIPQGCSLERVTFPDICTWPIVATFSPDGSLVIAESVWNMNAKETVQQQLISRPHRLVRLIDQDADGVFDKRQVIADKLSFPEGVLCIGPDIYVTAPPEIWKFSDRDGDGTCEHREVWFDAKTLTGCANDLHGPWLGPDGWIYWSKSAFAEQSHEILTGKPWTSKASHLYRRHPAGGPIDPVMTGGMDNLVDIAWLPNGDRFFCATFLHHPRHRFRDGIGAATYGALFGKPHAVLDGHPRTGPLMEPTVELGPAAPAGLAHLESVETHLGLPNRSSTEKEINFGFLVSAQFNLHQIGLHQLWKNSDQAHYRADTYTLLSSDRIDFHPVDVLLDSDASLLIVDTGGWYDLCCPSSGTDQRVATGGVYRLRGLTSETRSLAEQQRLQGKPSSFAEALSQATKIFASRGSNGPAWLKRQALTNLSDAWVATSSNEHETHSSKRDECILQGMQDKDPEVAVFAFHLASLYRIEQAREVASPRLSHPYGSIRRAAAELLGRIGIRDELSAILKQIDVPNQDRSIAHSLVYALVEGASVEAMKEALLQSSGKTPTPSTAALVRVLDAKKELPDASAPSILQLTLGEDAQRASLGLEVLENHPEWGERILQAIEQRFEGASPEQQQAIATLLARWSDRENVAQWIADRLQQGKMKPSWTTQILERLGNKPIPESWFGSIAEQLRSNTEATTQERAIDWQNALRGRVWKGDSSGLQAALISKLDGLKDVRQVLEWISVFPKGAKLPEALESKILEKALAPSDPTNADRESIRQLGWKGLASIQLQSKDSLAFLLSNLQHAGPTELPTAIENFLRMSSPEQDSELLRKLGELPAAKTLATGSILNQLKNRSAAVQQQWKEALEQWTKPSDDIRTSVESWLAKLQSGDPKQGYHVFRSSKASCSACHQVGYVGGNVGPVLSKIGQSRSRRDLVEAILFPSARLEQAYRGTKFRLNDGEVVQGLIVSETAKEVVVQVAADKRQTLEVNEIETREPSSVSIMPAGLESQLTLQELSDLIAFLENAK